MIQNIFLLLSFILLLIQIVRKWKLRDFNGPLFLPIIGNLYDSKTYQLITYIKKNKNIYGDIFTFWAGIKPMLVVCEPSLVRQVLSNSSTFIKGSDYTEKFSMVFGNGLVTSNGKEHKNDRICLGKYFTKSNIDKYLKMINTHTQKMMSEYLEPNINKNIDIQHFFHILSLRIFGNFSVGIDYSKPENRKIANQLNDGVKFGSNVIGTHIIFNIPLFSFLPNIIKLNKIVKNIDKHIDGIINDRIKLIKNNQSVPDDILTCLISENYERKTLHAHIRTLLSAGHDTTAFFGCYMTFLLAKHPDIQEKARSEIKQFIGKKNNLNQDDISNLKYCKMILLETLRLYTIIPFVNRINSKEYLIKDTGQKIPPNTTLLIPLSVINRDPNIWDNPNIFKPERFENINGSGYPKKGFLPFGYGSRSCVGNTLALTEGIIMLALLLQKYKFECDINFKPKVIAGISLISKNGIQVKILENK